MVKEKRRPTCCRPNMSYYYIHVVVFYEGNKLPFFLSSVFFFRHIVHVIRMSASRSKLVKGTVRRDLKGVKSGINR
jgi:hypothetical protein